MGFSLPISLATCFSAAVSAAVASASKLAVDKVRVIGTGDLLPANKRDARTCGLSGLDADTDACSGDNSPEEFDMLLLNNGDPSNLSPKYCNQKLLNHSIVMQA